MEFPDVGRYCAEPSCARLDFLPISCDACHKVFCSDHWEYSNHRCPESYSKDVQVPVCPLCGQAVPVKRGDDPNRGVDLHIQSNCNSKPGNKMSMYTYKCSYKTCKSKEMVQVKCATCHMVYCIRHRLEANHDCQGKTGVGSTKSQQVRSARLKALQQQQHTHQAAKIKVSGSSATASDTKVLTGSAATPSTSNVVTPTGNSAPAQPLEDYDEDEALARAIAASLQDEETGQKTKKSEGSESSIIDSCTLL